MSMDIKKIIVSLLVIGFVLLNVTGCKKEAKISKKLTSLNITLIDTKEINKDKA